MEDVLLSAGGPCAGVGTHVGRDRLRGTSDPTVEEFRWVLEEVRASLWPPQLKTLYPFSFKRLEKHWSDL